MAPFPKLPDLINTPPTGPTFDPNTYQNLVRDTLAPGEAELDGLQEQIDAMRALTATAELDIAGWISDLDELDAALSDFGDIEWGSPEPDLGPVTDYVTGQRDALSNAAGLVQPPAPLTLVQPSGQAVITLGGPPSQGGVATAGGPPYTLHLKLFAVGGGIHNVDADGGSGPNPPFAGFGPVVQETLADGKTYWVYHVQINPQTPGTFTGVAQYIVNVTITGISGTITRTIPFQVVVSK